MKRSYGWRPDKPDHRDYRFQRRELVAHLPSKVDLRPKMPPVYDQGELGSCTANAAAGALHYLEMKAAGDYLLMPSRLFIYYNERAIEGTISEDAGAEIRDGVKSLAKQGVCAELVWPYEISKFTKRPTQVCYTKARHHKISKYERVNTRDIHDIRSALANGFPVIFGFSVYESFESETVARTGKLNMPKPKEKMLGGHAVLAVGYNDSLSRLVVRNSWGVGWGLKGYFTMPYDYATDNDLADDFWVVRA